MSIQNSDSQFKILIVLSVSHNAAFDVSHIHKAAVDVSHVDKVTAVDPMSILGCC